MQRSELVSKLTIRDTNLGDKILTPGIVLNKFFTNIHLTKLNIKDSNSSLKPSSIKLLLFI